MNLEELKKTKQYLEEELLRKDKAIQQLKEQNKLLLKNSLRQCDENLKLKEVLGDK